MNSSSSLETLFLRQSDPPIEKNVSFPPENITQEKKPELAEDSKSDLSHKIAYLEGVIETLSKVNSDLMASEPKYVVHGIASRMDEFSAILKHVHAIKLHEKVNATLTKLDRLSASTAYLHHSMQPLLNENSDLRQKQLEQNSFIVETLLKLSYQQDKILALLKADEVDSDDGGSEKLPTPAKNCMFSQSQGWTFTAPRDSTWKFGVESKAISAEPAEILPPAN